MKLLTWSYNQLFKSTNSFSELAFLRRQQEVTARLSEMFLRGESREKLYRLVSESVNEVLKVDGSLLLLLTSHGEPYQVLSACGLCDKSKIDTSDWIENAQLTASLNTPELIVVNDYAGSKDYFPPGNDCFSNFRSGMSIRIPDESRVRGVFAIYHREPRVFKNEEQDFLKTIAYMLAGALSREAKEQALSESEARSKVILNTAVDGIVSIDDYGTITLFNQAAQKMFGYFEEEVLGKNVNILMPQPYQKEHANYIDNYKKTGNKKIIGIGREMTGLRKGGSTFPIYLAVSEFKIGDRLHFTGIIRDISEQRRLEQEVLRISDHERRRIGQDLHDGLGQMLTGIGLMSQGLVKKLKGINAQISSQAEEITQLIREADQYAKNLSRGLIPVDFEVRGLVTSLERLATNAERLFGIKCTFTEKNTPDFYDNSVVEHLFRITQEAISNAVKHGQAGQVRIELESNKDFACLRVIDDGKGFSDNWRERKGSGIDIMRFRSQLIGANLEVQNIDGGGAALICILPRSEAMYRLEEVSE